MHTRRAIRRQGDDGVFAVVQRVFDEVGQRPLHPEPAQAAVEMVGPDIANIAPMIGRVVGQIGAQDGEVRQLRLLGIALPTQESQERGDHRLHLLDIIADRLAHIILRDRIGAQAQAGELFHSFRAKLLVLEDLALEMEDEVSVEGCAPCSPAMRCPTQFHRSLYLCASNWNEQLSVIGGLLQSVKENHRNGMNGQREEEMIEAELHRLKEIKTEALLAPGSSQ